MSDFQLIDADSEPMDPELLAQMDASYSEFESEADKLERDIVDAREVGNHDLAELLIARLNELMESNK